MQFMASVWEPDLAEVHDECPGEHDPPPHRSVNVPEPEGEEQTVERLVAHLAAQVEHQVPKVVPDLNKKEQLVECLVTHLGEHQVP